MTPDIKKIIKKICEENKSTPCLSNRYLFNKKIYKFRKNLIVRT